MNSVETKAANEYVLEIIVGGDSIYNRELVSDGTGAYQTVAIGGTVKETIPVTLSGTAIHCDVEDVLNCLFKINE